ncbi:DNA repair RAD51-like protein [Wolffia australiana]
MPPLRELERGYPLIDSNFLRFCATRGIYTVEDFLVNDLNSLAALAESEPMADNLKKAIAEVMSLIDRQHRPWLNGLELLEDAQTRKRFLPTGCQRVDLLLQGGLRAGQLVELVGPSSSGKTQLCLQATAHTAHSDMGSVLFLDTGNAFSAERISFFLNHLIEEGNSIRFHGAMNRIICRPVFDLYELWQTLIWLNAKLEHQVKNEATQIRLLVIDSISSLVTPILGGKDLHGHSMMVSIGYALKRLADEYNLCVLVTNHMVNGEGGVAKPALGESWKIIPHVRLLLSRDNGSRSSSLSILKHTSMAAGGSAEIAIGGGGGHEADTWTAAPPV